MATPHVAGLIAYLITAEGYLPPANMIQKIQAYSAKNALSNIREYTNFDDSEIKTLNISISRSYRQLLGTKQSCLRTAQYYTLNLWKIPLAFALRYNNTCHKFTRFAIFVAHWAVG